MVKRQRKIVIILPDPCNFSALLDFFSSCWIFIQLSLVSTIKMLYSVSNPQDGGIKVTLKRIMESPLPQWPNLTAWTAMKSCYNPRWHVLWVSLTACTQSFKALIRQIPPSHLSALGELQVIYLRWDACITCGLNTTVKQGRETTRLWNSGWLPEGAAGWLLTPRVSCSEWRS